MNYVDNPFQSPAILSFCPGFLGLERGIERVIGKLRVAAYAEIEAFIIANLVAGMETGFLDPTPIWTDVKTFDAHPFRAKIHGIIGGYPCQPFSNAGKQLGERDPRHLWPFIFSAIKTTGPQWCFFENVAAHLKLGYRTVRSQLESIGYTVKEGLFTAAEVGAPHERKRLFILAIHNAVRKRLQSQYEVPTGRNGAIITSEEKLANSNSITGGVQQFARQTEAENIGRSEEMGNTELRRCKQRNQEIGNVPVIDARYSKLADAESFGVQGERAEGQQESDLSIGEKIPGCDSGGIFFPAGQGIYQCEWEEPRTIEPRMGCGTDGYNFREDLLRAFGNSVVEQQCELAFRTLLQQSLS